jgi:hypothetical protein
MSRINAATDLLLVGSLPAESTDAALLAGAEFFGDLVFALPDGETGPRSLWIWYEQSGLIAPHPDVETVHRTDPPRNGRHLYETPILKLRDGVDGIRWDRWPRIDDAIASYERFAALREAGAIPPNLRFQVGLPFPFSALTGFQVDFARDYPIAERAYEELVARELERLVHAVPAEDLAIQWDVCHEVLDIEDVLPWGDDDAWERFAGPVRRLGACVPEEMLMGYHLCYGTYPEWPIYEARDMGLVVRMANFAVANSGRPVDWLHLAGPRYLRSEEDRFFAPLRDLDVGSTRVFLGIILPIDGVEGARRRHATASRHLDDFGVAMYCGFGRQPGRTPSETLRDHREAALPFAAR